MCSLEIRDIHCLIEKTEVEEVTKLEGSEATNNRIGILPASSGGRKIIVVGGDQKYVKELLNSWNVGINWVICRI